MNEPSKMNRPRRRWWWGLGLVVVVGAALWLGSRGGKAEVKIFVVGFTNEVVHVSPSATKQQGKWRTNALATVLVTNTGSVALSPYTVWYEDRMLDGTLSTGKQSPVSGFGGLWIIGPIAAGKSEMAPLWLKPDVQASRYHVSFRRWGLRERLAFWCLKHEWDGGYEKLTKQPDTNSLVWATTGWITNPPPAR
jgi:hypothetical protein